MRAPILIATALTILPPAAHAAKGHIHGAAALDASLEREQMVLSLELPLDAATGFERPPKTPQEKAALEETARYLAPMMGGKFKSETTGRERRVKAVVEAMRVKIQTASGDHEAAILDQIVAMVESGIEVEAPPEIMDKVAKRLSKRRRS